MRLTRRRLLHASGSVVSLAALTQVDQVVAQTPEASGGTTANESLLEFARCIPLSLVSENASDGRELLYFGDFALRLAKVGVDLDAASDAEERLRLFFRSTFPVPAGDLMIGTNRTDAPLDLFGWTLEQIDHNAFVMSSEGTITVMRGSFDSAALEAAWLSQGYQPIDVEGVDAFSLSADRHLDPSTELGRITLGSANNTALLEDGLLLYAPTLAALTSMIQAHNGAVSSLGDDPIVQSLVDAIAEPLSGAMILPAGAFLSGPPLVQSGESGLEFAELPEPGPIPLMGLVGFVSGPAVPDNDITDTEVEITPSGSTFVSSRHFLTAAEAELAARRTLLTLETQSSFMTQRPWTQVFAGWQIAVDPENDTVLTEIDLYANEGTWTQLIFTRDAWFLYG